MLEALFTTEAMQRSFSERSRLQAMLDFEAALASAHAALGRIPRTAAATIGGACRADLYDLGTLAAGAARAGNLAIPIVDALTAEVAKADPEAAKHVHAGATSQDVIDTGLVLQMRGALGAVAADLERLSSAAARLAEAHAGTVIAGRTWLQHALPTTFGLKAAGWMSALDRHRDRLATLRGRVLVLQFGGAVGTLAGLGDDGSALAATLATQLGLALPDLPWHAHRDRVAEAATVLGLLVGTVGKIARDVSLLMQSEVREAFEPTAAGRGGSSTMPQKRNPVGCAVALAAATRVPALVSTMLYAMVQEHERGLGNWPAEWETLPEIFRLSAGALAQMADVVEGLEVDPRRMGENLEATGGLIYAAAAAAALTPRLGRQAAHQAIERAARTARDEGRHLRQVLETEGDPQGRLSTEELARVFDPKQGLGSARQLLERALAAHRERGD